jgi:hypothetical protein
VPGAHGGARLADAGALPTPIASAAVAKCAGRRLRRPAMVFERADRAHDGRNFRLRGGRRAPIEPA